MVLKIESFEYRVIFGPCSVWKIKAISSLVENFALFRLICIISRIFRSRSITAFFRGTKPIELWFNDSCQLSEIRTAKLSKKISKFLWVFMGKLSLKLKLVERKTLEKSEKKIGKKFFCTKKSEIWSATWFCF